jgi:hypothetical protein
MSIATYAELQTAIANFLNRDDLTSVIPDFIALCEAQINRDVRDYRMIAQTNLTLDGKTESLPADWVETIRLNITTGETAEVELASRAELAGRRQERADASGRPMLFAHVGTSIELFPTPDGSYTGELTYYQKVPDLATNSTNWLLTAAPDIYLYGSLVHSAPYLHEDNRAAMWAAMYQASVEALKAESRRAQYSGPLRLRTRTQ